VFCDTSHDLRDPILPLLVPVGHLYLATRQADHAGAVRRTSGGDGQVLDEGVEGVCHSAMPVQEVQYFVEEQQHRGFGGGKDILNGLSPWWCGLGGRSKRSDALLPRELASDVNPRIFPSLAWIPSVADEHRGPRLRHGADACLPDQIGHARVTRGSFAARRKVI